MVANSKKREAFRQEFDNFNVEKVAGYCEEDVLRIMSNNKVIHNRKKILATINNGKNFIFIQQEFGSFDAFIWRFVDGKPIKN
jgi:DNA-3-methyladenine glycosylase I